jgi:hypothetical protein
MKRAGGYNLQDENNNKKLNGIILLYIFAALQDQSFSIVNAAAISRISSFESF